MQKIVVNKKGNYPQLRLLFPTLRIADNNIPVYAPIIFSTFDYDVPDGVEFFFLQDKTGTPLDTQLGLCTFLEKIDYMPKSKIERLKKVESFGEKDLVYAMYHEAISLKIAARSYVQPEEEGLSVAQILKLPFYERILYAETHGPTKVFARVLKTINQYQDHDATMKAFQYKELTEAMLGWNTPQLKTFSLSEDRDLDCLAFLSSFPMR